MYNLNSHRCNNRMKHTSDTFMVMTLFTHIQTHRETHKYTWFKCPTINVTCQSCSSVTGLVRGREKQARLVVGTDTPQSPQPSKYTTCTD